MQVRFGETFKVVYENKSRLADDKFTRRQLLESLSERGIQGKLVKTDDQNELLIFDGLREDTLTRYRANEQALGQASFVHDVSERDAQMDQILEHRRELFSQPDGELTVESTYSHSTGGTYLSNFEALLGRILQSVPRSEG